MSESLRAILQRRGLRLQRDRGQNFLTDAGLADQLAQLGIDALGINFWPESRRYCPLNTAREFLPSLQDRILRVGVFVNAEPDLPRSLLSSGLIDVAQFHGDEDLAYCNAFAQEGLPFFKAIGVEHADDLSTASRYHANGILLDAHAPGVYGGTGRVIDWKMVAGFIGEQSTPPVILAGGITPENAAEALLTSRACALDVASGAESSPGSKDFSKVSSLLETVCSLRDKAD